jgi:hypothetical protein
MSQEQHIQVQPEEHPNVSLLAEPSSSAQANETNELLTRIYAQVQLNSSISKMTAYALIALLFASLQIALLVLNAQSEEFIEHDINVPFHLIEFWAIFAFTLLEAFLLSTSMNDVVTTATPPASRVVYLGTIGLNIALTLIAAILISIDMIKFETTAHFIEYVAQLPITLVDVVFVVQQSKAKSVCHALVSYGGLVSLLVFVATVFQLLVYCEAIDTGISSEQSAHFFEFTIELVNSIFALWFAIRNRQALHSRCLLEHV